MGKSIAGIILTSTKADKKLFLRAKRSIAWMNTIIIYETDDKKGSFADWRNQAAKIVRDDYIFYLDSDEIVSQKLKQEIKKAMELDSFSAYAVPRRNYIFGKLFKFTGQYPDYQIRLLRKRDFKNWVGKVHERPVFEGPLGYLKNPIHHYKKMTIGQMVEKTNNWSEIEAQLLFESGHPKMNLMRFISVFVREFVNQFILKLAFLDGKMGIIYGIYQIYSRLITYSKLWEKQQFMIRT